MNHFKCGSRRLCGWGASAGCRGPGSERVALRAVLSAPSPFGNVPGQLCGSQVPRLPEIQLPGSRRREETSGAPCTSTRCPRRPGKTRCRQALHPMGLKQSLTSNGHQVADPLQQAKHVFFKTKFDVWPPAECSPSPTSGISSRLGSPEQAVSEGAVCAQNGNN